MAKIKNAGSRSTATFDKIQQVLSSHGANKIMYDYAPDGTLQAITFGMQIQGQQLGFRLPAKVENVYQILFKDTKAYPKWDSRHEAQQKSRREQAYKTAWANIRDWIDAQMALIDTDQVKLEQVMLSYLITGSGETLYEKISQDQFKLLN